MKTALWFVLLLALGVLGRLVPHLPNFVPTLAIALFAASVLPTSLALITPLLSLFLGDLAIGFHDELWVVYLSLLPLVLLGRRDGGILSQSLIGSFFFYVTTNLTVWWESGMYTHSFTGLENCFFLALPFFGYSFAATVLYFGGLRLSEQLLGRKPAFARH